MTYRFVTSMSQKIYDDYGKKLLDSFSGYPLYVFSEDPIYEACALLEEPGLPDFLSACPIPESKAYQWQVGRFCKKVFSVSSDKLPKDGWRIWLDADVIVDEPFDDEWLKKVCPEGYMGSYLGRKDWRHSEMGWVAYNLDEGALDFLQKYREMYTSGEVFDHLEWHDCWLFDRLREYRKGLATLCGRTQDKWLNLSEGVPGMHPWDDTILGEKMRHLKGPLRKKGKTADVPAEYWSLRERSA